MTRRQVGYMGGGIGRALRALLATAVLVVGAPLIGAGPGGWATGELAAQELTAADVERAGAPDVAVDRRLARLLAEDPVVVASDTFIREGQTVPRSLLVLDATVILEGAVEGDLVLVDAGAFVRPGARVAGDLVNIGGGLYRSELAEVDGSIVSLPNAPYRVVRTDGRLVIEAAGSTSPLVLDGFSGFHIPTYDRVNGVTATWGATYNFPLLGNLTPSLHAQGGWMTERGEPTYGAELRLGWFATSAFAGFDKGWVTNDDWIRGDLMNSINYAWDGDDYRDYHSAERAWAGLGREFGDEEKRFHGVLSVRGQVEDARSLTADDPWHLLGSDSIRFNPVINEGRTTSFIAAYEMNWRGLQTAFDGELEYEAAREWLDGDFAFDRLSVEGDWAMQALANHTLEIEFFGQLPFSGTPLPRQRWSFVGGSGTLQTLRFAESYGDHVLFVESSYVIPMPRRLGLPVLGAPSLELVHAAGTAWAEGDGGTRDVHQEIGARLQFFALYVRYMLDPSGERAADLDIGFSWPFDTAHPWQRR